MSEYMYDYVGLCARLFNESNVKSEVMTKTTIGI